MRRAGERSRGLSLFSVAIPPRGPNRLLSAKSAATDRSADNKQPRSWRGVQALITAVTTTALWDYCCTGSHQGVDASKPSSKFRSYALPERACAAFVLCDELGEQPDVLHDHHQRRLATERG